MRFSGIAKVVRIFNGQKKSDTLVILPVYKEYACLANNLGYLARQTRQDFDVLVVLSSVSDAARAVKSLAAKKFRFKLIVSQRLEETGSAGGFYTGQVYALEKNYAYMVLADVDCYPVDRKLMEGLAKKKGKCIVLPKIKLVGPPGGTIDYGRTIPAYGLVPSAIVRQVGLIYAPFYNAGEDPEYYVRVQKAGRPFVHIERLVEHPNGIYGKLPYIFTRPHYILHALLINKTTFNVWVHIMSLFEAAAFFEEPFRGKMQKLLALALQFKYGKEAAYALRTDLEAHMLKKESIPKDAEIINLGHGRSLSPVIRQFGYPYLIKNIFTIPFFYFRKNVIIKETNSYRLLAMTSVFAKRLYYQGYDGRCLLVARNDSFLAHTAKILAFFLALPFALLAYIPIFLLMKKMRYPQTLGFGLS